MIFNDQYSMLFKILKPDDIETFIQENILFSD